MDIIAARVCNWNEVYYSSQVDDEIQRAFLFGRSIGAS